MRQDKNNKSSNGKFHFDKKDKDIETKSITSLRTHCISVRLNEKELDILNSQRKIYSKGEWLRMVLLQKSPPVIPTIVFDPIFPDTCYHLTHYWYAAADIPVASDNPAHYADAIRYNARTLPQGSLLPLTRRV
ncbi:putative transposase-like protein [Klebsiella michiganensis]|nr:putative transposase-like protein [Klebsiella michiganensis]